LSIFSNTKCIGLANMVKLVFFQCESPYDAPVQYAYMSESGTCAGYAAYKVADAVNNHDAYAYGIYNVLNN